MGYARFFSWQLAHFSREDRLWVRVGLKEATGLLQAHSHPQPVLPGAGRHEQKERSWDETSPILLANPPGKCVRRVRQQYHVTG